MPWQRVLKTGVLAVVIVWGLSGGGALADTRGRPLHVAILTPGQAYTSVVESLQEELTRLGDVPGQNLTVVVEDMQGAMEHLDQRVAHLMAAPPDVFVTVATPTTAAAKRATSTIPIVFLRVRDPLHYGLIASYASSRNNLTGIGTYAGPLTGKRLEILNDIAPGITRILAVVDTNEPTIEATVQHLAATAQKLGIQVLRRDVKTRADLVHVLQATPPGAVDALFHVPSVLVNTHIDLLIQKALQEHLPLSVHEDTMVEQGALVSYGADDRRMAAQAATLVAKILRGAQPADLPIQIPAAWSVVLNLTTAKAIGLVLPPHIVERADRLVE